MEERLRSRPMTALLGAIAVLGGMEELRVLEMLERKGSDREAR